MSTSAEHGGIILPVGLGIGATQDAHATMSPWRAADLPLIITVIEPIATRPGPPGTQGANVHGTVMELIVAAARLLMFTLGDVALTI